MQQLEFNKIIAYGVSDSGPFEDLIDSSRTLQAYKQHVGIQNDEIIQNCLNTGEAIQIGENYIIQFRYTTDEDIKQTDDTKDQNESYKTSIIDFYGDEIISTKDESTGIVYVPIKPLCKILDITPAPQYQKFREDPEFWNQMEIHLVTKTGPKPMICLPLDNITGWLFSINVNHVGGGKKK